MGMRLKNSRGLFFSTTGEPQMSYWANPKTVELIKSANGLAIPKDLLDWDPCAQDSRSNCPMLHRLLKQIVNLVDPKWRARANNIYAGRTYSDEDTALANKNLRGGMVAISNQYATVLIAYASMLGSFVFSVDLAKSMSERDSDAMWHRMRKHLDESIDAYKVGGILALKGNFLMVFPSERFKKAVDKATLGAEAWTIAHELGHHLVRDMSSRRDKEVEAIVRNLTSHSSVSQEIQKMSSSQRDEIVADLLATLIIANHFSPQDRHPGAIHEAIDAAALSLITIAHLRDEWTTEPTDSHPGCLDRLRILLTVTCEMYGNESQAPNDPKYSHILVYRRAALLMTYGSWVKGPVQINGTEDPKILEGGEYPPFDSLFTTLMWWVAHFMIATDQSTVQIRLD